MSSETREISHCHGLKGPSNGESPFLNNTFEPYNSKPGEKVTLDMS